MQEVHNYVPLGETGCDTSRDTMDVSEEDMLGQTETQFAIPKPKSHLLVTQQVRLALAKQAERP